MSKSLKRKGNRKKNIRQPLSNISSDQPTKENQLWNYLLHAHIGPLCQLHMDTTGRLIAALTRRGWIILKWGLSRVEKNEKEKKTTECMVVHVCVCVCVHVDSLLCMCVIWQNMQAAVTRKKKLKKMYKMEWAKLLRYRWTCISVSVCVYDKWRPILTSEMNLGIPEV